MDRPLSRIVQVVGLAESNSTTDRRKFLNELRNVYDNEKYVAAIDAETAKPSGNSVISWDRIMLAVHEVAMSEVDNAPVNNLLTCNSATGAQTACSALLVETTQLASATSDMSPSYTNVMAIVFPVLKNTIYRVYYDTYLDILVRCILKKEMFRIKITGPQWQDILRLTIGMYKDSSNTVRSVLLKTMRLVVRYGCPQSHLALDVRRLLLPFLGEAFRDDGTREEFMLRQLYKLTYTICLEIGTESRTAVCEFTENIISSIIHLEGCPEMYKMLLLLIEIYRPSNMMDFNNDDSNQWATIIRGIYWNISRNIKAEKLDHCFLQICCEVYREIFREPMYLAEASLTRDVDQDSQARKTRRLAVERPADMLLMKNNLPFIEILTVLLEKYPDALKSSDYPEFLNNVTESIGKSLNDDTTLASLSKLSTILVKMEKKHYNEALEQHPEKVRVCWQQIWETVVRATSMKRNEILCHQLLQSIIQHRNVTESQTLLRLYLNRTIPWSSSSVETLLRFWIYVIDAAPFDSEVFNSSQDSSATIRDSLLHWSLDWITLSRLSLTKIPVVSLSQLLTSLAIKSHCERRRTEPQRNNVVAAAFDSSLESELLYNRESKAKSDIERCNLTLMFRRDPFDDDTAVKSIPKVPTIETKNRDTKDSHDETVEDIFEALVDALVESLTNPLIKRTEINMQITKVTVVAKILSNFAELNVEFEGKEISRLVDAFREAYKSILSAFMTIDNITASSSESVEEVQIQQQEEEEEEEEEEEPIEALERFYRTQYHWKIEKMVVELTGINFIKYINQLLLVLVEEPIENLEKRKIKYSDRSRVRNSLENIITYYCIGEKISPSQMTVLKNFLNITDTCRCNLGPTANCGCIRRALRVLAVFGLTDRASRSSESLETIIEFVDQVLKLRGEDERVVRGVLKVVPYLIGDGDGDGSSSSSIDLLVSILRKINQRMGDEKYGPLVHAEFVKCLAQVIRANPLLKWQNSRSSEASQPIIQLLISHIGNPFYAVRLEVARALCIAFSLKQLDVEWKLKIFEKISIAVAQLFDNQEKEEGSLLADELATRRITAVQILAGVIRGSDSRQLRSRALIAMIELTVKRDINVTTIKEALVLSTTRKNNTDREKETTSSPRHLVEMNLRNLLLRWLEDGYQLERFPWLLTDCQSHEDFSRRYIETLATIKLQRLEFQCLENFCKNIGISFAEMIENSFAPIMSLLTSMKVVGDVEPSVAVYAREIHERLRTNVGEFSGVRKFHDLLEEKLSQVVVDIIKRLHDQRHFGTMFDSNASLPDNLEHELIFDKETVDRCLWSLEKDLGLKKDSLVEYFVTRRPSILQKILLTLVSDVYEVKSSEYEPRAFYRYAYFSTRVFERLSEAYFDDMSLFVVRDVAHSVLGCINAEDTLISKMVCSTLERFLCAALPERANHVQDLLSFIVSSLLPVAQSGKVKGAMSLLRYLIIDQRQVLAGAIKKLGSFPDKQDFEEIKRVHYESKYCPDQHRVYSLEKEIEHFLDAIDEKTLCCTLEELSHLENELSTRKDELRQLYSKLKSFRGFSEDCASSTLHRLIYRLVRLTRSSDADISLEAARCLGQLGPADLATVILHPENEFGRERRQQRGGHERLENLTINTINHLSVYLVDRKIELRKASADALYTIFSTSWARPFTKKSNLEKILENLYGIENSTLYQCIYPFVRANDSKSRSKAPVPTTIRIDDNSLEILINQSNDLWIPKTYFTYSKWILDLISRILDCFHNFYAKALVPVCTHSVQFSEMLLPRLVHLLIDTKNPIAQELCSCINRFFGYFFESVGETEGTTERSSSSSSSSSSSNNNKNDDDHVDVTHIPECIHSMLSIVNFMRLYSIENNAPLTFDYLLIAYAAHHSSAYFTSLLCAELSCQTLVEDPQFLRENQPGSWISAIDSICDFHPTSGRLLQHIIREASLHIGDPDSIYGCGLSDTIDSSFRAQHYTHREQWDKVILEQDMELDCSASATRRDMLNALERSGRRYLGGLLINTGKRQVNDNVDDSMYEAAWRLTDWSSLESQRGTNDAAIQHIFPISHNFKSTDYHASHYHALECLRDRNFVGLTNALANARKSVVRLLRKTTKLECSKAIYPALSKLQMLREIEEFGKYNDQLLDEWNEQDFTDTHDLRYVEPVLSQRIAMYQMEKSDKNVAERMDFGLIDAHMKIAQVAEKQGYLSTASRALHTLGEKRNLPDLSRHKLTYQKALLAWKEDERDISRYLLRDLINQPTLGASLRVKALRICGNFMAESKRENPQTIIQNYYEESIRTCLKLESSSNNVKSLTDARASLGQFADAHYQQINRFTKLGQRGSGGSRRCKVSTENADVTEATIAYRQQVTDDDFEFEDSKREIDTYLLLAANNYLLSLQNDNDHDFLVFRLVALWLDNTIHKQLNEILEENLPRIASYKFITLLCQIAPHMSNVSNDFTAMIHDLMERCAKEHPHHTLPILFALKNTYKDEEFMLPESSWQKHSKSQPEPRVIASEALISELMSSEVRPIIQEVSLLSNALIMLAYYKVSKEQANKPGVPHSIPRKQAIMRIRDFMHTIVPTISLNVNPRGNYENIVGVSKYKDNFEIPGGVNAPKVIVCLGTDGIQRRQLVKGQDDLRQDAVMQQFCTVMNSMLKTSRETERRRLHIRTYKIVPLSRRSGVIEWCENTQPIARVLTDTGRTPGLHTKYYPNDWSVNNCRQKIQAVANKSRDVRLKTFLECCQNLHPAFHHFFLEKYPSAEMWFERRLAYVRSVATSSMVGYMLGLGDRHLSNILIDETTAEVIHIDFGIAFAQGKVLQVPETVPFRLTRDIEVAMGICGVEGVMRRSCEETVAVLRNRRETLITMLQVLLYDPLFSWAITPVQTNDLETCCGSLPVTHGFTEHRDNKKTNEIAEKALLRIDEKLRGSADGTVLSIPGQVERLIQQARDPVNLCRLFSGWQAYL